MKSRSIHLPVLAAAVLCSVLAPTSCRNRGAEEKSVIEIRIDPKLAANRIADLPGAVYQAQAESPIHWQPFSKETFDMAKAAHRLVFCVVAMPQYSGFKEQLDALAADPGVVADIHDNYVPVLVDGDASREIGLLAAELCSEIKTPVRFPLFLWLSPDGNPVSWIPVNGGDDSAVVTLFRKSNSMVVEMWRDDPEYVVTNSAADNAMRRERMSLRKNRKVMSEQPAIDTVRAIRQLASLYDTTSRSFDEAGGLFPSGAIDLLAAASIHPGLAPSERKRCGRTLREVLEDLLRSPMFDPLDGGLFSARQGPSWKFPMFQRDCPSQARAAVALIQAWRATGEPLALQRAEELIRFAEATYRTGDGLFAIGSAAEIDTADWLWSVEDIRQALPAEDVDWWIRMNAMKGLGNLPSESDPGREYFRGNTLSQIVPAATIAADFGMTDKEFAERHEKARRILLALRQSRTGAVAADKNAHLPSSLRMVSAYAFAFSATGEPSYRDKAAALLNNCRKAFYQSPELRVFSVDAPAPIAAGRAFHYALAIQAAVDVSSITSDEQWLIWSEDLATTAAEMFTGADFLKECPDDAKIIDLPVTDLMMVFDDSTAGLVSFAESRLSARNRPLVRSFSELATPLPTFAVDRPILHTDLIEATLARSLPVVLLMGDALPDEMRAAVERIQPRMIQKRKAAVEDQVPAGAIKVQHPDGGSKIITRADELSDALLPSARE
ncbi:MAG: thioredoxin domain-containing protein [Verrucomicrobiae bacterium]|nr:thioredoxin domain-containing protein [Verrucomicrobiae bacterium]